MREMGLRKIDGVHRMMHLFNKQNLLRSLKIAICCEPAVSDRGEWPPNKHRVSDRSLKS